MNLEGCESLSGAIIGHDMAGRGCWGSPSSFVRVRGDVSPTLGELSTTQSYLHTTIKRRRLLDSIFRSLTHSECLFLGEFNGVHLMGGEVRSRRSKELGICFLSNARMYYYILYCADIWQILPQSLNNEGYFSFT